MERLLKTIAEEVAMLRKLAVFALLESGASQEKVAAALGVSQATISRLAAGNDRGKRRRPVGARKRSSPRR